MRVIPKAVTAVVALLMLVGYVSNASATQTRQCQQTDVKISASTSRPIYGTRSTVKLMAKIHNVSSTPCTAAIGGTSPSMVIKNAKGVVVWDNCYSNDQPGACAQYLALRTLKPGAWYSITRTWTQHIGGESAQRGTYKFQASFSGFATKAVSKFTLVK